MSAALVCIGAIALLAVVIGLMLIDWDGRLNGPDDHTGA